MTDADEQTTVSTATNKRSCFVVSAFGATPEDKQARNQVLKHLIRRILDPKGYEVIRADQIADEGLITNHIIEHLLEDDVVVADLTGLNPNVFYEIAVRHAARKPIVHLITSGVSIPFDVANMRAVQYALDDPDRLEEAQRELEQKIQAIEDSGWKAAPNPITSVRNVAILRESEEPGTRDVGNVLAAVNDLRSEIQGLRRRIDSGGGDNTRNLRKAAVARTLLEDEINRVFAHSGTSLTTDAIAESIGLPPDQVLYQLRHMADGKAVYQLDDGTWLNV